jgi:hypothetical protein
MIALRAARILGLSRRLPAGANRAPVPAMIFRLSDPLFRPGMAAFQATVVTNRLRSPTFIEVMQSLRQSRQNVIDLLV